MYTEENVSTAVSKARRFLRDEVEEAVVDERYKKTSYYKMTGYQSLTVYFPKTETHVYKTSLATTLS